MTVTNENNATLVPTLAFRFVLVLVLTLCYSLFLSHSLAYIHLDHTY